MASKHTVPDPIQLGFAPQTTLAMPMVSREMFAQLTGLTAPTVFSMCDRGYLPTLHFGRRVFVNLEALRLKALQAAHEVVH